MIGSCRKAVVGPCLLAMLAAPAFALQPPLNQALNEEIATIPYEGAVTLETTIFKPDGPGPFPLVVINHGKDPGNPALQARARHFAASREFVRRGYAVVLPMRAGFSKSGGSFVDTGCDIAENGRIQAGYVRAAIDHMKSRPYVDARRIVVVGQSHGGLTTMALGTVPVAGVLGLVNFAGGLKVGSCPDWPARLTRAFGDYGSGARLPSGPGARDGAGRFPAPRKAQCRDPVGQGAALPPHAAPLRRLPLCREAQPRLLRALWREPVATVLRTALRRQ